MVRMEKKIASSIREKISEKFSLEDSVHDISHHERVMQNSLRISESEGGDKEILAAAAMTHDIHRLSSDGYRSPEESLEDVRDILESSKLNESKIDKAIQCVKFHDDYNFSGENRASTLNQKILQDADNLDAMGAVGVARAFAFGGRKSQPFNLEDEVKSQIYDPSEFSGSVIGHFHEKLFKLKQNMNTDTARKIADNGHDFMKEFVERFQKEINGNEKIQKKTIGNSN